MDMTMKELAQLGYNMRQAQSRYFRDKTGDALNESRRLEREFDAACKDVLWGQKGLFDETGKVD